MLLYIRYSDLIHFKIESLYPFTYHPLPISPFPQPLENIYLSIIIIKYNIWS